MKFDYLSSAELSDIGRQRRQNEDAVVSLPDLGVFGAFDGMGGSAGGGEASRNACEAIRRKLDTGSALPTGQASLRSRALLVRAALNEASKQIRQRADAAGNSGSGTTAVVMVFDDYQPQRALVLHAGDSRVYRFRNHELVQVTRDHSFAVAAGVASERSLPPMFRGVVTRAVGLENEVVLEETSVDVAPGDLFMMCTDGLTKMVSDSAIAQIMASSADGDLQKLSALLVEEANVAGGHDNVSVVLIGVLATMQPVNVPPSSRPRPDAEDTAGDTVDITAPDDLITSQTVETAAPAPAAQGSGIGLAILAAVVAAAAAFLWIKQGYFSEESVPATVPNALTQDAESTNRPAPPVPAAAPTNR